MIKKTSLLLLVVAAIIVSGCLGGNQVPPVGGPGGGSGGGPTSSQEKPRIHVEIDPYNAIVTLVHDGGGSVALNDVRIEVSYDIQKAVWDPAGDQEIFKPGDTLKIKTTGNQIKLNGVETKHSQNDQPVSMSTGGVVKVKMIQKSTGAVIVEESKAL